jgi:hypothetical protein
MRLRIKINDMKKYLPMLHVLEVYVTQVFSFTFKTWTDLITLSCSV